MPGRMKFNMYCSVSYILASASVESQGAAFVHRGEGGGEVVSGRVFRICRRQPDRNYTTFGELGEIIKSNWADFNDIFQNIKALEKMIATLNVLRGPLAHCKPLAEDEVVRLH
jgi:hypothetical protein